MADKTIFNLPKRETLPEKVYVPASDENGKCFSFEYCDETKEKVIKTVKDDIKVLEDDEATSLFNEIYKYNLA